MLKTVDLKVGAAKTTALVSVPTGKGPHPGIVVAPHSSGLDPNTEWLMEQMAAAGYAIIAPNHYHVLPPGVGIPERKKYLSDEQILRDLLAAVDWLKQPSVDTSRLALIGSSMGGRSTFMGLASAPTVWKCACVWYGGGTFSAYDVGKLPAPAAKERLTLIQRPIIGFFGDEDENPSPADVKKLDGLLTDLGKEHSFHRYKAPHGFLNAHGSPRYRPEFARDSIDKAQGFLARHLVAKTPATT